jgi:cell division protein FtsL
MRLLNFVVIVALVLAAGYVYQVKFESTLQAERVAKLRSEIRRERDTIAALRAEWSRLDTPARVQALAQRHLPLKPVDASQFDGLERVPERALDVVPPVAADPIAAIIGNGDLALPTGGLPARGNR